MFLAGPRRIPRTVAERLNYSFDVRPLLCTECLCYSSPLSLSEICSINKVDVALARKPLQMLTLGPSVALAVGWRWHHLRNLPMHEVAQGSVHSDLMLQLRGLAGGKVVVTSNTCIDHT